MNSDDSAAGITQSLPLGVRRSRLVKAYMLRHFADLAQGDEQTARHIC